MKMIEWIEPFSYNLTDIAVTMRVTVADAIRIQRDHVLRQAGWVYLKDEYALDDFIAVHWARAIDTEERGQS